MGEERAFVQVLSDARRGDAAALEILYRGLAPSVLGYLRGQGAAEPEDLASEVFVALVRNLARFDGDERALRSWVFTVAHRRLVDERRRRARRPEQLSDPADLPAIFAPCDPESEALDRVTAARVLTAMDLLTDDQRAVVLLRLVADLPVAEVARVLNKQEGAVKTLQRRALARLARELAPQAVS